MNDLWGRIVEFAEAGIFVAAGGVPGAGVLHCDGHGLRVQTVPSLLFWGIPVVFHVPLSYACIS